MSNNINRMKRNKLTGKKMGILAAAALTAALITGSVPVVTEPVSAAESQEKVSDALIPDNITIDQPTELANIALPITEHGTLEWADGSFVPTQRVQACEVFLIPAEGQDLSHAEGWDSEAGAVVGYINVEGIQRILRIRKRHQRLRLKKKKILPITKMVNLMK